MTLNLMDIWILIAGGLLAGIVDTIIGGGGLFSLPTLLLVGLPPQAALGTNQFALSFGSLVGTYKFSQKRYIKWWPETFICLIGALPGTILGCITAIAIPPAILQTVVVCLLVIIGVVVLLKRNFGDEQSQDCSSITLTKIVLTFFLGVFIGFYEGFFGPGTGILITFSFVLWLGFSFLQASGTAKAVSLLGNVTAFITYALFGNVHWISGLILAASVTVGAYFGVFFAQRGGSKVIRPVMLGVIILLIVNVLKPLFIHS
ncbi:sulfite exporter TauE/SafE family protein [Scopulibacillus cellulosilyticus]|uniref:Probable membrane transporter protein n=1 Tax=Scopulibacillus cellulosilyticus TaxID=2665665 RepID=A0ABW2Q0G7_9BACL